MRKLKTRLNLLIMCIATHFFFGKELRKRYHILSVRPMVLNSYDHAYCVSYAYCVSGRPDLTSYDFYITRDIQKKQYDVKIIKCFGRIRPEDSGHLYIHTSAGSSMFPLLKSAREFIVKRWKMENFAHLFFNSNVLGGQDE